jgi:multidrug efflux pump subunit AcrA (membrane-fusion protein)
MCRQNKTCDCLRTVDIADCDISVARAVGNRRAIPKWWEREGNNQREAAVHKAFLLLGVGFVGVAVAVGGAANAGAQPAPRSHVVSITFSLPVDSLARMRAASMDGAIALTAQDSDGRVLSVGRISVVDNQINRVNGTVRFIATFDNTDEVLSPGQFVNVGVLGQKVIGEVSHKP